MSSWELFVTYDAELYFKEDINSPKHMDRVIARKLGKRLMGSGMEIGMGMWKGAGRDVDFSYRTEKAAKEGQKIAKRIKGVLGTEILRTT